MPVRIEEGSFVPDDGHARRARSAPAARPWGPRRRFVLDVCAGIAFLAAAWRRAAARTAAPVRPPLVGAIRWDAWQAPHAATTEAVVRSLSPRAWRDRLPFFSRVAPDGAVSIDGGTAEVMDRELELAARAGLDYWAFVAYRAEDPMSAGLDLYLKAQRRRGVRFCLIAEPGLWGGAGKLSEAFARHVELVGHPDHVRVKDGRPLYFMGFVTDRLLADRWGGAGGLRDAVAEFRRRAVQGGAGNPYVVLMARPDPGAQLVAALGADALGAYAIADPRALAAPYAALARLAEQRWNEMAATGLDVVPTAMAGWDRRPRVENPVPWERSQRPGEGIDRYYEAPGPAEFGEHVRRCLAWIRARPAAAAADAALIYAWNEYDEGGWLAPTHPFDDRHLAALRSALCKPDTAAAPDAPRCVRRAA